MTKDTHRTYRITREILEDGKVVETSVREAESGDVLPMEWRRWRDVAFQKMDAEEREEIEEPDIHRRPDTYRVTFTIGELGVRVQAIEKEEEEGYTDYGSFSARMRLADLLDAAINTGGVTEDEHVSRRKQLYIALMLGADDHEEKKLLERLVDIPDSRI